MTGDPLQKKPNEVSRTLHIVFATIACVVIIEVLVIGALVLKWGHFV